MNLELLFSLAGLLAMLGWIMLLASPRIPKWSDRISGWGIPIILSLGYLVLIVFFSKGGDGGFGSLAEVALLFSNQEALLAGWIHYLAFDLFIGAWICRTARQDGISFWLVLPCLPLTFLVGPAGFLAFVLIRYFAGSRAESSELRIPS